MIVNISYSIDKFFKSCYQNLNSVRRCETIQCLDYRRNRGRPKKSWSKVIRHDLRTLGLVEDMAQDRKF